MRQHPSVSRILYDLTLLDDRRPSPYCWRVKYALAHKGLDYTAQPLGFTEIPSLHQGQHKTVPVLEDHGRVVGDSWAIVDYLDAQYPDRTPLYGSPSERGLCRFVDASMFSAVTSQLVPLVLIDIHNHARPQDRAYLRETRERRLGKTLEAAAEGREHKLDAIRAGFGGVRQLLTQHQQPFIAGAQPGFADYIAASPLLWAASVSQLPVLTAADPVNAWFERVRDLFGQLGRSAPMYENAR